MTVLAISSASRQYVYVPIRALLDGHSVNTTADSVWMAVVAAGAEPATIDWRAADWDPTAVSPRARCLVGPGGPPSTGPVAVGEADVYVRFTDNPEQPVLLAGRISVS